MPRRGVLTVAGGVLVVMAAGCASSQEWATWKEHPTHFASGDHLSFSVHNPEGGAIFVVCYVAVLADMNNYLSQTAPCGSTKNCCCETANIHRGTPFTIEHF